MRTYTEPVSSLLSIGRPKKWTFDEFPLLEAGIGREHIRELLELANDPELSALIEDVPKIYGPIHAWCALGQLKAVEAIESIRQLLLRQTEDSCVEWYFNYLPDVIAELGSEAIPVMGVLLADRNLDWDSRMIALEALNRLADRDDGQRQACVEAFVALLKAHHFEDPTLLGFAISALLDIRAIEAADDIQEAFRSGHIDETIAGNWEDVKYHFEHGSPRPIPPRRPPPQPNLPFRSAEDRKARNNARKKLEKQSKKKR